jgi:hypothetical protein
VSVHPPAHAARLPAQVHFPFTQGCPPPQAAPHAPQLSGSEDVAAQLDPQAVLPPAQPHEEERQSCVAVQVAPQPPQFDGSAPVSTQPLPQRVKGAAHAPTHTPAWHSGAEPVQA